MSAPAPVTPPPTPPLTPSAPPPPPPPPRPDVLRIARTKRHTWLIQQISSGRTLTPGQYHELEAFESASTSSTPSTPSTAQSHLTQEDVAAYFEVDTRTVRNWHLCRPPVPRNPDGTYDLKTVVAWNEARPKNKAKLAAADPDQESDPDYWDMRYRRAKALMAEDLLAVRRGDLLRTPDVERGRLRRILETRNRLLPFARQVIPQLQGLDLPAQIALVDARIREIISIFSGDAPSTSSTKKQKGKATQ